MVDYTEYIQQIESIPLFRGMEPSALTGMLGRSQVVAFEGGQVIYSAHHYRQSLGVVLEGRAEVRKKSAGHFVTLNHLKPPQIFGAAVLFQPEGPYVSEVVALERSVILFIGQELLLESMRGDFALVENYLAFLSGRIRFLNAKIDSFIQTSAESKLALYLLKQSHGKNALSFPVSLKGVANELNLGRASLYRALDALTEARLIERDGKQIRILDKDALEQICL